MKNKGTFIAVIIILIILVGVGAFFTWKKFGKIKDKGKAIDFLLEKSFTTQSKEWLNGLNENFVLAWANAGKRGDAIFELNGKTYNVSGGKAVK